MSIVFDPVKEIFIVDTNIRCSHCGFEGNPKYANCCGRCGKSLQLSISEMRQWNKKEYPFATARWKVYDSHNATCIKEQTYVRLVEGYYKLKNLVEKEKSCRAKGTLFSVKNDSFILELEAIAAYLRVYLSIDTDGNRDV